MCAARTVLCGERAGVEEGCHETSQQVEPSGAVHSVKAEFCISASRPKQTID